jgi:hypothetical protein
MRGEERQSEAMFSYIRLEERVAKDHPLRPILRLVNEVLAVLSRGFEELYSHTGRPPIAPEYLLRATLLQPFFTVGSVTLASGTAEHQTALDLIDSHRPGRRRITVG